MSRSDARIRPAELEALPRLLSYRIAQLSRLLARDGGRIYSTELGLTLPQWRVLSTLGILGELGVSAIAEHAAMDRGQASRTLDTLIARGLVRMRPDHKDRRSILLSLSNEGESRYAAGLPVAFKRQRQLVSGFGADDIAAFSRVLDRMIDKLDRPETRP